MGLLRQEGLILMICFAEYPGVTPLMALTVMTRTLGVEPLRALLKDVNVDQRLAAMRTPFPQTTDLEASTLTQAIEKYQGQDIIRVKSLNYSDIDTDFNLLLKYLISLASTKYHI